MWPFKYSAPQPPRDWAGPVSFFDWTEDDIAAVSKAIRKHGQADSAGWRTIALVALNTLRGGSAVELVARAIEKSMNPDRDPDRPITGSHYMAGMPFWCMWVEDARPAVEEIVFKKSRAVTIKETPTLAELNALLNSEDDRPIAINPDGSIRPL